MIKHSLSISKSEIIMKKESDFQKQLIKEIKTLFKDCIVLKTNPKYLQGIPDLLILFGRNWAALEVKQSPKAKKRPNQERYVNLLNKMSFASFINPQNKEEVLNELQQAFRS